MSDPITRASELGTEHGTAAGHHWLAQRDHWERDGFSYRVSLPTPDLSGDKLDRLAEDCGLGLGAWQVLDSCNAAFSAAFSAAVEATIRGVIR